MTGLEKILSQIEYESNDRCQTILRNAEQKAESIINEAQAEADRISAESDEKISKRVNDIQQSTESSSELAKSKIILKAKLEAIDSMLDKSLNALKSLSDNEYFDMIKTLVIKNAKAGEGCLCLPENDFKRLPDGFIDSVNAELSDGKAIIKGSSVDIDSGFILTYGDIDINCSFDAIAAAKRDELRDSLNSLLFAEQEARLEE